MKKVAELHALINWADGIIQEHKDAGCHLPESHQGCTSLVSHPLHNDVTSMEHSVIDSSPPSAESVSAGTEQGSSTQSQDSMPSTTGADPKALFSGEILVPVEDADSLISWPDQQARSQTSSSPARQTIAMEETHQNVSNSPSQMAPTGQRSALLIPNSGSQSIIPQTQGRQFTSTPIKHIQAIHQNQQFLSQVAPTGQRSESLISCSGYQTRIHQAQGEQVTAKMIQMIQQNQEVATASVRSAQPTTTSSANFSPLLGRGQVLKTGILKKNGQAYRVIYNDKGQCKIMGKINPQSKQTNPANSTQAPDNQSANGIQIQQPQRQEDGPQNFVLDGNVPVAPLLGNVNVTTNGPKAAFRKELSWKPKEITNNLWNENEQLLSGSATNAATSTCSQQDGFTPVGFSYTKDLNMYGNHQAMHQIQNLDLQTQNGVHGATLPVNIHSSSSVGIQTAAGLQYFSQARIVDNTGASRTQNETAEKVSNWVNLSVACAPAMLDMLEESEVSPSLQKEIKATLASDSFSVTQSQAESLVSGSTAGNDLVMETQQMSHASGEQSSCTIMGNVPVVNQAGSSGFGPGFRFQTQGIIAAHSEGFQGFCGLGQTTGASHQMAVTDEAVGLWCTLD